MRIDCINKLDLFDPIFGLNRRHAKPGFLRIKSLPD